MAVGTNGTATTRVRGIVASVNERGLKLQGHADWLNFSQWAGAIVPPARGQAVTVTLDGQGFVRAVEPAESCRARDTLQDAGRSKDTLITRQTCVKAAAASCAARPDLKSADLLAPAGRPEAWVGRP
jgi:hypothetical protein